jgi:hypothetical protein
VRRPLARAHVLAATAAAAHEIDPHHRPVGLVPVPR